MQGYTGALFRKFRMGLCFSVRNNACKTPFAVLLKATILMHVEPCSAVFFSLPQVCESWDPHAKTMTERGILHLSNLHTTPHTGWENEASLWAEVVSLYLCVLWGGGPVCIPPTPNLPWREGRADWILQSVNNRITPLSRRPASA